MPWEEHAALLPIHFITRRSWCCHVSCPFYSILLCCKAVHHQVYTNQHELQASNAEPLTHPTVWSSSSWESSILVCIPPQTVERLHWERQDPSTGACDTDSICYVLCRPLGMMIKLRWDRQDPSTEACDTDSAWCVSCRPLGMMARLIGRDRIDQ